MLAVALVTHKLVDQIFLFDFPLGQHAKFFRKEFFFAVGVKS